MIVLHRGDYKNDGQKQWKLCSMQSFNSDRSSIRKASMYCMQQAIMLLYARVLQIGDQIGDSTNWSWHFTIYYESICNILNLLGLLATKEYLDLLGFSFRLRTLWFCNNRFMYKGGILLIVIRRIDICRSTLASSHSKFDHRASRSFLAMGSPGRSRKMALLPVEP